MACEIVSLDNDEVVHLYITTNRYELLDDEGETPNQPDPTWLISEDDMAEALLSLKKLGDLPNKIHPARALKRAEVEYKLNKLDDERVFALAKFFGCHSASTRRRYRRHQGRHWHAPHAYQPARVRRARRLAHQLQRMEVKAVP